MYAFYPEVCEALRAKPRKHATAGAEPVITGHRRLAGKFSSNIMRSTSVNRTFSPLISRTSVVLTLLVCYSTVSAHPPTGIVLDSRGNAFFTNLETVWKIDPNGALSVIRAGVSGRHVHELSIDDRDNLYGADLSYESGKWISSIWKISSAGDFSFIVSPTVELPRSASIWLDGHGGTYSVDQDNHTKKKTIFFHRSADGSVTPLAGGAYGFKDGTGADARLGSIGGLVVRPNGDVYFTDNTSLRKVTREGVVTTIARNLNSRTAADRPLLFGSNDGLLTGLTVDSQLNAFICDAGNQRLLKINSKGTSEVIFRGEEPYYANGVVHAPDGDLYLLEVGFQPPSTWLPARVRRLHANGKSEIIATSDTAEKRMRPLLHAAQNAQNSVAGKTKLTAAAFVVILAVSVLVMKLRPR